MDAQHRAPEIAHNSDATDLIGVSPELIRLAWSHRRSHWWARPPFLPLPSSAHLAWRRETAYGSGSAPVHKGDLAEFAAWSRRQRKVRS